MPRNRLIRRLAVAAAIAATALVVAQVVFAVPPGASFTIDDEVPEVGQNVTFTSSLSDTDVGQTYTYQWDFGDGGTSSAQNPSHSYNSPGQKTVTLTVSDSGGETDPPVSHTLRVNARPTASVSCSPSTVSPNQATTCNGGGSSDPEGPVTYAWDIDGNGFNDGTDASEQFSFATPGAKTIRLRVTDSDGATATAQDSVTVSNATPTASFTFSPQNPTINQTVTFDGSASSDPEGQPLTYAWDLDGDGQFNDGSGVTATRAFGTGGNHTVQLRVTDPQNNSDTDTKIVTVGNSAPSASFNFSGTNPVTPAVPDVGEPINFTSTSTDPDGPGDIARLDWDLDNDGQFDDGSGATIQHSFPTRGNKTVGLRVTDNSGLTNSTTRTLRVNELPVARPSSLNPQAESGQKYNVPLINQPILFTGGAVPALPGAPPAPGCPPSGGSPASPASSDAEGAIAKYEWDLNGDGIFETDRGTNPDFPHPGFPTAGNRTAVLRVTDSDGGTAQTTLQFRVNTAPTPEFVYQPDAPIIGDQITFGSISNDPDAADAGKLVYSWDLDNDGTFCEPGETGASVTHSFATANPNPGHPVTLRVTDDGGITRPRTKPVPVQATKPAGSISFSPNAPLPGQAVTFTGSASSPTGKAIASMEWDFSYNQVEGFNVEAAGASVSQAFPTPGLKTVALKVQEAGGGFDIVTTADRLVVNAPPRAGFVVAPENAFTGDDVTLSSTSADPDGPLGPQNHAWDLDNDGEFDDATATVVTARFANPGTYPLKLRVTDSRGATSTATGQVIVQNRPVAPLSVLPGVVVTLRGSLSGKMTKVKRLFVRAPTGSKISVRCSAKKKKSCPKRVAKQGKGAKRLRFKKLERRFRAGTKLIVSVTKTGFIGRQTSFTMRRGKEPKRRERCLTPGVKAAQRCPSE